MSHSGTRLGDTLWANLLKYTCEAVLEAWNEGVRVIAIANQKGGVAKTTTAVNLASGLALNGTRTLLVDLDPQANATQSLPQPEKVVATVFDVLSGVLTVSEATYAVDPHLDLLASHIKLAKLEPQLQGVVDAYRLRDAFNGLPYEYIVVDCPPSLGPLTTGALVAATHVLVPVTASYYGLNAVADFMETYAQIQSRINLQLRLLGIVITIFDRRLKIANDVATLLRENYRSDVLTTVIEKNVRLDEAASGQTSIFSYDGTSRGAENYRQLLKEVLERADA